MQEKRAEDARTISLTMTCKKTNAKANNRGAFALAA
jgi:hypothetical protein